MTLTMAGRRGLDGQARDVGVAADREVSSATDRVAPSVAAGQPSRSAIMAGITPMVPSVEAMPQITRSGPAFLIAAASTALVARASEPCTASSMMWMPAEAPICSAALDRVGRVVGAERHGDHLDVVAVVGDLQGLLHGVLVKLGQQSVARGPVDRAVGGKGPLPGRVGNVLDQHDDLHLGSALLVLVLPALNYS